MKNSETYDVTNTVRILTPGGVWITLLIEEVPVDIDLEEPAEAVYRLSRVLQCDVSLEQKRQVTVRWKE